MKLIKRILLCFIILAEVIYTLQPMEIIAKNNVVEQYNKSGKDQLSELEETKVKKTAEADTEPIVVLPEASSQSPLLSDYLAKVDQEDETDRVEIQTAQVEKTADDYALRATSFSSYLPALLSAADPIRLQYGDTTVTYQPLGYNFASAIVNKNTVMYYSDQRNTIFRYYADISTFKEEITMLAPQASYEYHYQLKVTNGSIVQKDGQLYITGPDNQQLMILSAPVAIDAAGADLSSLPMELTTDDEGYQLTLTVDSAWMNADERVFPVIIDPQFKDIASETDTTIREGSASVNYASDYLLSVGSDVSGRSRAFFQLNDDLIAELTDEGADISQAYLSLYVPDDTQLQDQDIQLCALSAAVAFDTATWDNANGAQAVCQDSVPVIDQSLKYFTDFFDQLTAMPTEFGLSYQLVSGTPVTAADPATLYYLFDGDSSTGISTDNGDAEVEQTIIIDLNQFIRPEEIKLNFGGDADSSGENLSIEFINTNTHESFSELVSNGMSAQDAGGDYEVILPFAPSVTLYNQVKLTITSTQAGGKPRINEFQITRYQLEEHYVKIDLKAYLTAMLADNEPNYGFYLRLADETAAKIDFVSNDASEHQPEVLVDYTSTYDVSPRYALNDLTLNLRPEVTYSASTASYVGVTFDGVATPGSVVRLYFKEYGSSDYIVDGEAIDDITTGYLNNMTSNYQSAHNFLAGDLKQNGVYQVEAEATKDGVTGLRTSETFMIAYLSYYNNLADVAFFYGVDAETLRQDNHITGALDAHSVLFVRNPKRNLGKAYDTASLDYITDTKASDYLLGLNSFNEYYLDRVNVNTGNYHLAQSDMTFMMFGEEVNITRVYNSKNSLGVRQFGQNWDYNFNFILMNYDDNKLVFKKEDGQKVYFEKNGTDYVAENNDIHTLTKTATQYIITGKDRTYYFTLDGQITKLAFNTGKELNYVYNASSQLTTVVLQNNDELAITYGDTGLITALSYVAVTDDKRTVAQKVSYVYDANDQLIQVIDPLGFTMTYTYDELGRITAWTDFDNHQVDQLTYDNQNRVTSVTNANGIVNSFTYFTNKGYTEWRQDDVLIKKVTYNAAFKTEKITYANGSVERKTYRSDNGQLDVETLMNEVTLTYAYDANQNITSITRSDGHVRTFTYDSSNNMLSETDYLGRVTAYQYQNNLLTKKTYADQTTENYTYENGILKTYTNQNGNLTTYTNDSKGRQIMVTYANGETLKTQYNLMGYASRETDTNNNKRVISRNYRNEIVYETTFEGDITETTYNGSGYPLSLRDGNYNTRTFTYNALGLLVSETDPYGNYLVKNYDDYGNLVSEDKYNASQTLILAGAVSAYDQYNRLISVQQADGSYERYQYNIAGELERKINSTTDNGELITLYRYDRFTSNIIQEHLPDGNVVTRNYDANGNLLEEITAEGVRTTYAYDQRNQLITKSEDSGLVTTYEYDYNGNQTQVTQHETPAVTYYTNWSDWILASTSGIASTSSVEEKTQYREKEYEERWVRGFSYLDYTYLDQDRELNSEKNWAHTDGRGLQWQDGYAGLSTLATGEPVNFYGYKDYESLAYCPVWCQGTDGGGTYCEKFYYYYLEYKFGGYPTNFSAWQDEEIIDNEQNIVETRTVYSVDGQAYTTTVNPSVEDTDLIDKEALLKRKFYATTGFGDWVSTAITPAANKVIEERYLYREKKVNSIWSSNTAEPGYVKTTVKTEEEQIGGYLHTDTLGLEWKVGLLGELVHNGKYINLYGYKDYGYAVWGFCPVVKNDSGGDYCEKVRFKYVNYKYESSGSFGDYQEDAIIDTANNVVESIKQYRSQTRDYSDYQLLADSAHPNESDLTKDEVYLRTRFKMVVPADVTLYLNDTFAVMDGVSATDAQGNDITSSITVNISTIDTTLPGTYELIYTLGTTGLEVIRLVDVLDNQSTAQADGWTTMPASEVQLPTGSNIVLVTAQEFTNYLVSDDEWTVGLEEDPGTTPESGDTRLVATDPYYKEKAIETVILPTSTAPDSTYIYMGHDHTSYSDWSMTVINWDACSVDTTPTTYGGIAGLAIKYRESGISGYWTDVNHNTYYYSYYDHYRCGYHAIYKYPKSYSDTHTAYKVDEYTRTFTEMYKYYVYGEWSAWIAGTLDSDNNYVRLNQDLYKYLDGTSTGYIETLTTVPDNYYVLDTKTLYTYQTKNVLSIDQNLVTDEGSTVDLSEHFQYTNPVSGNLSAAVTIQVLLNGRDLSSQLNGRQFTFNEVGLYQVVYQADGLSQTQTVNVRSLAGDRVVQSVYNQMNQLVSVTDALGQKTDYAYANGQMILKTDALGNQYQYTYDRNNRLIRTRLVAADQTIVSQVDNTYDNLGNILSETDLYGYTTHYVYDANSRLIQLKKPVFDSDNAVVEAITQYVYDAAGRLVEEINPYGLSTKTTYDQLSRVLSVKTQVSGEAAITEKSMTYDINGNVLSLTKQGVTTLFTYNQYNDLIKEVQANGLNTYRTYDRYHRLLSETASSKTDVSLLDADDRTTTYRYDHLGQLSAKTDVLGRRAIYRYDAYGNIVAAKDFDGLFTKNYYNANDQLELTVDGRNNAAYYYYNELNQLSEKIDVTKAKTAYTYDMLNNVLTETNALNETTVYEYDMYNKVTKITDAKGQITLMTYTPDHQIAEVVYQDADAVTLKRIEYQYDLSANPTAVTQYYQDPLSLTMVTVKTQTGYNAYGEVIQTIDARNYATSYTYNTAHQLVTTVYPNGLVVENTYDDDSHVLTSVTQRDPHPLTGSARTTSYQYDVFGNLTKTTMPNGSFTAKTYTKDNQVLTQTFSNDELTSSLDDYVLTYSYDGNGRLLSSADNAAYDPSAGTYGPQTLSSRTYNRYGDLIALTDQAGLLTTYEYDLYGRTIAVTQHEVPTGQDVGGTFVSAETDLTVSTAYDCLGRVSTETAANGLITAYVYDALGNVIQQTETAGSTVHQESYVYDRFNNVISATNALGEVTVNVYNALNQLVKTTGANQETTVSAYDKNGNLISRESFNAEETKSARLEYVYDNMNQPLQTKQYRTVNGTLTSFLTTNTYTLYGELAAVQDPSGYLISYDYDVMGNKQRAVYAGANEINYQYTAGNQLKEVVYSSQTSDLYNQFTSREVYRYYIDGKLMSQSDNPPASTGDSQKLTEYTYDNGLLSQVKTTLSSVQNNETVISAQAVVSYQYDVLGRLMSMSDQAGQTLYQYDSGSNISQVTRIQQTVTILNWQETMRIENSRSTVGYTYDPYHNQTTIIYPDQTEVSYQYDSLNRISSVSDEYGTTSYTYNTAANQVITALASGETTTATYELGQVIQQLTTKYDSQLQTTDVIYEQELVYDETGNVISEVNVLNGVTTMIANTYDSRSTLVKSEQTSGSQTKVYEYIIDPFGNKNTLEKTYVSGTLTQSTAKNYTYDHLNQLVEATID
ncbi:MAG: DUF6531 domain-containing protein, partial [Erysipelotrichaceae bacterium]|nr:DUF6531 domain-containing protein [Erysipelotrichaceae bacterium]